MCYVQTENGTLLITTNDCAVRTYSKLLDYISVHCSNSQVSTILSFYTGALCIRISTVDNPYAQQHTDPSIHKE